MVCKEVYPEIFQHVTISEMVRTTEMVEKYLDLESSNCYFLTDATWSLFHHVHSECIPIPIVAYLSKLVECIDVYRQYNKI